MKSRNFAAILFLGLALATLPGFAEDTSPIGTQAPEPASDTILDKKVSVNVKDLDAKSVLGLLSEQAGVPISVSTSITGKVSYAATDLSVKQILDEITSENGMSYTIQNGTIIVSSNGSASAGGGSVRRIPLQFGSCTEILAKILTALPKGEKLMADETSNSLIYMGSPENFEKVSELAALFDSDPKQIMIQGLVVETSDTFLQNIGFSYGGGNATVTTTVPSPPNLALTAATIAGHNLNLSISAAESRGDAKVISRPKLVTLNNKSATLNSGLTINVKTLSTAQSAQPGQVPVAVTGGLAQVNAGLTVNITPTIVGENRVKLQLSVSDSSPDSSSSVDGIPGVDTNAATTTVIVENDRTAIIAGLIKQTRSSTHDGVPFLMDIPILGGLFRSNNKSDQNNELAIFITPSILQGLTDTFYAQAPSPRKLLDGVGNRAPARVDTQALGFPEPSTSPPPQK